MVGGNVQRLPEGRSALDKRRQAYVERASSIPHSGPQLCINAHWGPYRVRYPQDVMKARPFRTDLLVLAAVLFIAMFLAMWAQSPLPRLR